MPNSAIAAVAELAANSHSVITRSQAAAHLTNKRIATAIRTGWLTEPYPGVLSIAGGQPTFEHRLRCATLAAAGHGAASHRAAARLHAFDGAERDTVLELSVSREYRWQIAETDVVTHHVTPLPECDLTVVDGITTTTTLRTLADLGSVATRDRVAKALTDVRRRKHTVEEIRTVAERLHRPGQSGTSVLLRMLDAIPFEGRVPDSWFEEVLARCLDDRRLPPLVPQYEIRTDDGAFVARVDLAIPHLKLAIEAHSKQHHFGPTRERLDADRDLRAAACGWELLYLGWHATKRPDQVVDIISQIVATRLSQLGR